MSHAQPATPVTDPPPCGEARARAVMERQLGVLARLGEIGMAVAEAAGRRAVEAVEGGEAGLGAQGAALGFARAARAVRLTLALEARVSTDLLALDRGEAQARAAEAGARRRRAHRLVERAIEDAYEDAHDDDANDDDWEGGEDEIERLSAEAWERLTEAEDLDLLARPMGQVVALVCAALGLPPGASAAMARPFEPEPFGSGAFDAGVSRPGADAPPPLAPFAPPTARLGAAAGAEVGLLLSARKARERLAGGQGRAWPHPAPSALPSP